MNKYVILVRHGTVDRANADKTRRNRLSDDGRKNTIEVAEKLAEVLHELPRRERIEVGQIWYSSAEHSKETAEIFHQRVCVDSLLVQLDSLRPDQFGPYEDSGTQIGVVKALDDQFGALSASNAHGKGKNNAIIIVGHEPLVGWIAYELHKTAVPIERSSLICLASGKPSGFPFRRRRWSLLWEISPSDPRSMRELREKIKSKMGVARLLGAVIIAVLGFVLDKLEKLNAPEQQLYNPEGELAYVVAGNSHHTADARWALYVSAGLFLIAIGLYLATMYSYDRLLMPIRFWAEKRPPTKRPGWLVWRPPSSATWVLYQNMMRIWTFMFTPATYAVIAGLLAFAYAVLPSRKIIAIVAGFGAVVFAICYRLGRPRLGSQD